MTPEPDSRSSCRETREEIARLDGRINGLHVLLDEREKHRLPERVGDLESKVASSSGRSIGIGVVVALLLSAAAIVATFWKGT